MAHRIASRHTEEAAQWPEIGREERRGRPRPGSCAVRLSGWLKGDIIPRHPCKNGVFRPPTVGIILLVFEVLGAVLTRS